MALRAALATVYCQLHRRFVRQFVLLIVVVSWIPVRASSRQTPATALCCCSTQHYAALHNCRVLSQYAAAAAAATAAVMPLLWDVMERQGTPHTVKQRRCYSLAQPDLSKPLGTRPPLIGGISPASVTCESKR
eukprot:10490-Heterococcus_DN1.PRE.1